MFATLSTNERTARSLLLIVASAAGVLAAGAAVLWGYYGTAVFFEIVRTGWAACF